MRHRVALLTLAMGLAGAGNALAFDVTPVIYDLNSLDTDLASPTAAAPSPEIGVRVSSLPLTTPSLDSDAPGRSILQSEDNLELGHASRGPFINPGVGAPRDGNGRGRGRGRGLGRGHGRGNPHGPNPGHGNDHPGRGHGNHPDPTPNPEPGTMLLLGSALVTGARYARRRRRA